MLRLPRFVRRSGLLQPSSEPLMDAMLESSPLVVRAEFGVHGCTLLTVS